MGRSPRDLCVGVHPTRDAESERARRDPPGRGPMRGWSIAGRRHGPWEGRDAGRAGRLELAVGGDPDTRGRRALAAELQPSAQPVHPPRAPNRAMATAIWCHLGRILWIACLLPLAPVAVASETLQGIQVLGPTKIQAFQRLTVTLNFLGSPPLNVCWRLKSECLPLEEEECHPVSVASTAYNLTHIFHETGDYCFSIRAENVISKTHQYHKIHVQPSSMEPAVFAFPCATLITMMLAFIMYTMLRNIPQQNDMVENPEPSPGLRCCCQVCCGPFLLETPSEYLEVVREHHGLLPPRYKPMKTYTV
uniref:transmembrane protein 130 isoform X2 n=1 Tax=Jaculus jaculus TaxID=51337 RepID=UPI001E1B5A15|nr:transmembrane protein 130 isoform X2 [Jaculus jaculus]